MPQQLLGDGSDGYRRRPRREYPIPPVSNRIRRTISRIVSMS
jgi:hypothetical protein